MKRERKEKHFIKPPEFPGGNEAMRKFVSANLKYPTDALEQKIEGTVRIRIVINYKGQVIETHIADHLGYGCDEEADRVARLLKFNVPNNRVGNATFNRTLNIHFRLPKPTAPSVQVQYSYTTKPQVQKTPDSPKPSASGYTITIVKK